MQCGVTGVVRFRNEAGVRATYSHLAALERRSGDWWLSSCVQMGRVLQSKPWTVSTWKHQCSVSKISAWEERWIG